jgi:hypothetical protein
MKKKILGIEMHVTSPNVKVWKARDIGKRLGFGAGGGNFSRMFNQDMFDSEHKPQPKTHWVELPANPTTKRGQKSVWLTTAGVKHALDLLIYEGTPYSEKAKTLRRHLEKLGAIPISRPREARYILEEVLGAAMAVRYTKSGGILAFVFLDEDDKQYPIPTDELDKGWQEKLLKAMGSWPKE